MGISIVILVVSFVLEIILNNFLPFMVGDLSLFTPLFVLVSLFIIYPFFKKNQRMYFIISFLVGFVYDLLFTNLIFYNAILFVAIAFISNILYKYMEIHYLNLFIYIVLLVIIYEVMNAIVILLFNLVPISFMKLVYKISHSLVINILYGEVLYFIINHFFKKHLESSIN